MVREAEPAASGAVVNHGSGVYSVAAVKPEPIVTMPSGTVNTAVVPSEKVRVTVWFVMARIARNAGGVVKNTASATAETSSVAGAAAV